jgi:glucose dehydrogenase
MASMSSRTLLKLPSRTQSAVKSAKNRSTKSTGKLLWEAVLPAPGNATPAVYELAGRQYVVIGAGGGKWGNPSGGTYVAFALPRK